MDSDQRGKGKGEAAGLAWAEARREGRGALAGRAELGRVLGA